MRTKVIPAQITTVEDKIAGNLSLTQIMILISPVFLATIMYVLFPPSMQLVIYKVALTAIVALTCIFLSLRIDGVVVAQWLIILFKYNLRPRFYVFNKNDTYLRLLDLPKIVTKPRFAFRKVAVKEKVETTLSTVHISDAIKLEYALTSKKLDLKFRVAKKGGLNVAFQEIAK